MIKFVLSIAILISPMAVWAQQNDAPASADMDRVVPEGCRDFTAEQMKDPNSPCYEDIRADVDPRKAEGDYYEPNISASTPMDECGGCHVLTAIDVTTDTNKNIYEVKFLKNAVPQIGAPADDGGGAQESGTD